MWRMSWSGGPPPTRSGGPLGSGPGGARYTWFGCCLSCAHCVCAPTQKYMFGGVKPAHHQCLLQVCLAVWSSMQSVLGTITAQHNLTGCLLALPSMLVIGEPSLIQSQCLLQPLCVCVCLCVGVYRLPALCSVKHKNVKP